MSAMTDEAKGRRFYEAWHWGSWDDWDEIHPSIKDHLIAAGARFIDEIAAEARAEQAGRVERLRAAAEAACVLVRIGGMRETRAWDDVAVAVAALQPGDLGEETAGGE